MKAHKYWSLGALACMAGCFYTGCKKLMQAHKYFACGSLVCMGMAVYSGHKIAPKKKKAEENVMESQKSEKTKKVKEEKIYFERNYGKVVSWNEAYSVIEKMDKKVISQTTVILFCCGSTVPFVAVRRISHSDYGDEDQQ